MLGDIADFVRRQRQVLPTGWFSDQAPTLDAVLAGFGTAWSALYNLINIVKAQTRLATATNYFLDMICVDFFGSQLSRKAGESDTAFQSRVQSELFRSKGTRRSVVTALEELTGQSVSVFEPACPSDTGGYSVGGVGYCAGGGWGSLGLPFQSFVGVKRPHGLGIALLAGYGTAGVLVYGNVSMLLSRATDADIYAMAAAVIPTTYKIWVRIDNP